MPLRWDHALVDHLLIGVKGGLLTIHRRQFLPKLSGTLATAITNVEGNDVLRDLIYGQPNPLDVGLLLDKAMHLTGFCFQVTDDEITRAAGQPHMQTIRSGLETLDHKID